MVLALLNAAVILSKCTQSGSVFAVRIEETANKDWMRTWAFPIDESVASKEKFEKQKVQGNLMAREDYPGCPHCKTSDFVHCGTCNRIFCYHGQDEITCPWCGNHSKVVTADGKLDFSSAGY